MPTAERIEKKTKQPLDYNAFLRSLQLFIISLKESACDIDRQAYWEHKERSLAYKMNADCVGIEDKFFDVRAKLEVTMTGGKEKTHQIKISATFDLHFHSDTINKTQVDRFCNSDVRLIIWPYFREYVSDISSRMYVPPVLLPLSNEE